VVERDASRRRRRDRGRDVQGGCRGLRPAPSQTGGTALEVLDAAGELVALGAQRIELLLARQPSLLLLSERRLQRRLSGIDVLHLSLETRHPLLGGKPTGKERVGEEPGQQDRGDDDEPGSPSTRLGDHGP